MRITKNEEDEIKMPETGIKLYDKDGNEIKVVTCEPEIDY